MSHTNIAKFQPTPINQPLGNEYLNSNPPKHSPLNAPLHHLQYIIAEKLKKRENQTRIVEILREYVASDDAMPRLDARQEQQEVLASVTRDASIPARLPCFIDSQNRHCAVAHLMKCTGAADLAQEIATKYKYAYVKDIAQEEQDSVLLHKITQWSTAQNLSLQDLAMIQPTYEFMNRLHPDLDFSELSKKARQGKQQNLTEHKNYRCKNCGQFPIRGVMYLCANCPAKDAYALCESCERQHPQHDKGHVFLKVEKEMKVDGDGPLVDPKRMTSQERE